jgi:hypothetical protein
MGLAPRARSSLRKCLELQRANLTGNRPPSLCQTMLPRHGMHGAGTGCGPRRPRLFRGSGIWARRSRRYWLPAGGMDERCHRRPGIPRGRRRRVQELPSFRPGPARHPQTRRTHRPLLRHRRSQSHFTTLPYPWAADRSCRRQKSKFLAHCEYSQFCKLVNLAHRIKSGFAQISYSGTRTH